MPYNLYIYKLLFKGPRGAPGPRGEAGFDGGSTDGAPGPKGNQGRQGIAMESEEIRKKFCKTIVPLWVRTSDKSSLVD